MLNKITSALPHHLSFLKRIIRLTQQNEQFCGLSISGSASTNNLDKYSDLDLVLAVKPQHYEALARQRKELAASYGELLGCFTGEHVGEPKVLICLYQEGDELLHVDLKFVPLSEVVQRVDNPIVLWEEDSQLSNIYQGSDGHYPIQSLQWYEDRFWVWVHYGAARIGRGELFEAFEFVSFLRQTVIAPLAKKAHGLEPNGVRRIEQKLPELANELKGILPSMDKAELKSCLYALADLYIHYREMLSTDLASKGFDSEQVNVNQKAQTASLTYLANI
ncbi:oxalate/formate antiporter [Paraglaciecola mesophila KMM 241]|uniref:Oxalate/formate antiporter n=1 Tax=Paraglaciecola mesophila KMM 241 TaxID=1128912 RepID=K6XPI6_9ALTE|nr:aminoglycoside 6-adenylyltransferase [Paraglaciecola mesophila]GAC22559.1 oxalate/formate antiporter [Paraglaciecola mesophila KMM 241]